MGVFGTLLMIVGFIVVIGGGLWFLVVAFQESVGWGLGCMFVPFVSLIFVITHWDDAGKPFLVQLAGIVPIFIGTMLSAPAA